MIDKEFMRSVSNGRVDLVQLLLDLLKEMDADYCVIGGLAVNAYTEPVVSLDLDIIVAVDKVEVVREAAGSRGWEVEKFEHSINLSTPQSDLRIQLQTDERYQAFIARAQKKKILGYPMIVASLEDIFQGKVWACQDETRRRSKRQKDLADIARLIEIYPALEKSLPEAVRNQII